MELDDALIGASAEHNVNAERPTGGWRNIFYKSTNKSKCKLHIVLSRNSANYFLLCQSTELPSKLLKNGEPNNLV